MSYFPFIKEDDVLEFLDAYGAEALQTEYQKTGGKNWTGSIQAYRDLTNDGVPELVIGWGYFYVFGCKDARYTILFVSGPDPYNQPDKVINIEDTNRNGVPELVLLTGYLTQGGHGYQVIEWDGEDFKSILESPEPYSGDGVFVEASGKLEYEDIDHDGWVEYIVHIGIPVGETYQFGIPWRQEKQVFRWNGEQFLLYEKIFLAPEYRFQAVQDGDRAAQEGDYDNALDFYQQAIFNDKLEWWSPDRHEFVRSVFMGAFSKEPTPVPPLPDPNEYDNLAAYSRYRIMLLHLARGWVPDAKFVYDTLQKKYPEGKTGHIYAALAEKAWTEYSQSGDLKKSCGAALKFASQNFDAVYYYIGGSGFPGNGGIDYTKQWKMICPFE